MSYLISGFLFVFQRVAICWSVSCSNWFGYKAFRSLFETFSKVSLSEQARSSLVSSPLIRLLNMFLGWAELYSKYWNLLVGLKNGFMSSTSEVLYLGPL